ncbi:MAG: patatin-like phospholipase family protein [Gammaproteobacteria bacterium]
MKHADYNPVSKDAPGPDSPEQGIGLCLSGGGYRAMLFHLGVVWRLAELGYLGSNDQEGLDGNLGTLERVSSVSGGSIISAQLGLSWDKLRVAEDGVADRYRELVVGPIMRFASQTTISWFSGIMALIFSSMNRRVVRQYRDKLYGHATLQDFPDQPRFVVNATNLQSGALWRFSKPYSRDWRVGEIVAPVDPVAKVVGASSAFPPFLSPARFRYTENDFVEKSGDGLQQPPYTTRPELSDGGVYDNMGLETVFKRFKTLIVSNAGGGFKAQPRVPGDWVRLGFRVFGTTDNQVRSLRKRALLKALTDNDRSGAYWSIRTNIEGYDAPGTLPCPFPETTALANMQTDLAAKDEVTQKQLINWGYAICDAGMRSFVRSDKPPYDFPFPEAGVGPLPNTK